MSTVVSPDSGSPGMWTLFVTVVGICIVLACMIVYGTGVVLTTDPWAPRSTVRDTVCGFLTLLRPDYGSADS